MDRRVMILGAAGASALLLTGCLGEGKGEAFVGYWANDTPIRQGAPKRLQVVVKIERTGETDFWVTVVGPMPFNPRSVKSVTLAMSYRPENRLAVEQNGRVSFITLENGSIMMGGRALRRSTREEFDGFPASLAQPQQRR